MKASWLRIALASAILGMLTQGGIARAGFVGSVTHNGSPGGIATFAPGGHWETGQIQLDWDINQNVNGSWNYKYTFKTPDAGGNLSHIVIELSASVTLTDILNLKLNGASATGEVKDFSPSDPGNSNPNLPGLIHGLKVSGADQQTNVISFDIFRAPTWGDFYAKDGNAGGGSNEAWNTGFLDADPTSPPTNGANFNSSGNAHILRPDTFSTQAVPEPSSMALLFSGVGVIGVFGARRLRGRKPALAV